MILLPVKTRRIEKGDDIVSVLIEATNRFQVLGFRFQDILVISSKAVATAEGRILNLQKLSPSDDAKNYAKKTGLSPAFCQGVLEEMNFRNGKVVNTCPGAMLTELKPQHDTEWTVLAANAGLDQSNVAERFAVGWPEDPVKSVARLRRELEVAVILSDSCCTPRRQGVTAFALAVSGLDPIQSVKGELDLFGKPLRITQEAVADQLATAANMLMGNAGQGVPAVIVREHGLRLSEFEGWVPGIEPEEDLFRGVECVEG